MELRDTSRKDPSQILTRRLTRNIDVFAGIMRNRVNASMNKDNARSSIFAYARIVEPYSIMGIACETIPVIVADVV